MILVIMTYLPDTNLIERVRKIERDAWGIRKRIRPVPKKIPSVVEETAGLLSALHSKGVSLERRIRRAWSERSV